MGSFFKFLILSVVSFTIITGLFVYSVYSTPKNDTFDSSVLMKPPNSRRIRPKSIFSGDFPSLKLTKSLAISKFKDNNADSLIYSPYSVDSVMFSLFYGSSGATQTQFERVFGFSKKHILPLNPIESDQNTFTSANSLWVSPKCKIKNDFVDHTRDQTNAQVLPLTPNSEPDMNKWAYDHTNGLINKLVPDGTITDQTLMVLANALYFKGTWNQQFPKKNTHKKKFTTLNWNGIDSNQQVDMMVNTKMSILHKVNNDHEIVILPYKGVKFMMAFIKLKDPSKGIEKIADLLSNPKLITKDLSGFSGGEKHVEIPKFTIRNDLNLNDAYKSLGLTLPFDTSDADFSSMMENQAFVELIQHNVFIKVDEEGTEAAATTAVVMSPKSLIRNKRITINSSFGLILLHQDGGIQTRLFQGIVKNPK